MNALKKALMSVAAALAVAPAAAFAYPPQCDDVCHVGDCTKICYLGTFRTTCGEDGYCFAPAPESQVTTASVSEVKAQEPEAPAPVCSDAEQTASVES